MRILQEDKSGSPFIRLIDVCRARGDLEDKLNSSGGRLDIDSGHRLSMASQRSGMDSAPGLGHIAAFMHWSNSHNSWHMHRSWHMMSNNMSWRMSMSMSNYNWGMGRHRSNNMRDKMSWR